MDTVPKNNSRGAPEAAVLHVPVRLKVDLPEEGLSAGDIGTVVHVFTQPCTAYEVEFSDERGRTTAQVALLPAQVEVVPQDEASAPALRARALAETQHRLTVPTP
jgi:hypothetical protein